MNTNTNAITVEKFQTDIDPKHPRRVSRIKSIGPVGTPPQFKQWNSWDRVSLAKLLQERLRAIRLLNYLPKKIEHARKLELSHLVADLECRLARAKSNHEVLTNKINLRTDGPVVHPEKFLGRGARARLALKEVAASYKEVA